LKQSEDFIEKLNKQTESKSIEAKIKKYIGLCLAEIEDCKKRILDSSESIKQKN